MGVMQLIHDETLIQAPEVKKMENIRNTSHYWLDSDDCTFTSYCSVVMSTKEESSLTHFYRFFIFIDLEFGSRAVYFEKKILGGLAGRFRNPFLIIFSFKDRPTIVAHIVVVSTGSPKSCRCIRHNIIA